MRGFLVAALGLLVAAPLALLASAPPADASVGTVRRAPGPPLPAAPWLTLEAPLSRGGWWLESLADSGRLDLRGGRTFPLLARYSEPQRRHPGSTFGLEFGVNFRSNPGMDSERSELSPAPLRWGDTQLGSALSRRPASELRWGATPAPLALDELPFPLLPPPAPAELAAPAWLPFATFRRCAPWQEPRAVTFLRHGAESDTFPLLSCDGAVAPEALDRLSVMARPEQTERPPLPLPLEAQADAAARGEWVPNVKLLHPRLVWAIAQLAAAFPWRPLYVVSGYRPGSHRSQHQLGTALDVEVVGAKRERVWRVCHTLPGVACGFYPNHGFIHVDVRDVGVERPFWIDVSAPGEPSEYVDSWPGIAESGGLQFAGGERT